MAERTVKVTMTAQVSGYLSGLEQMRKKTKETSEDGTAKLAAQGKAFGDLGAIALKAGAVVAVGIGVAIARFADFDKAISNVQAATQASAEDMGLLRDAALEAGASTVFTAVEAANAIEELGKAGLTTAEIIGGGLDGALSLAAAGQLGVARAAEVSAIAVKQFGLEGSKVPHIADLLAAGAGKAVGSVEDLAQALGQSGLVANAAGLSIEETTGVLSAFADAGLTGSDAGTSLKSALQRLTPVSAQAKEEMDRLGISAFDAQGDFIGAAAFAGNLQDSLKDLTPEQRSASQAIIFGSDAVRASNRLYELGAEGVQKYIDQTNDSGFAAKVAADRLNNLSGDVEKLGGAFDTALIKSGSGANDVLRQIVQNATFLVDALGSVPEPVANVSLAFGVATAAILLTGGTALTAIPKFAALKETIALSGVSMGQFAVKTAAVGGALGLATIAVGYFVGKAAEAAANTNEFRDSLDETTGALTGYTRELVAKKLAESGAFDAAKAAGISQRDLTDAVLEGGDALDSVKSKLTGANTLANFFNFTESGAIAAGNATDSVVSLADSVVDSKDAFLDQKAAANESTDSTLDAAAAYKDAASEADALQSNLSDLIETINKANGVGQDAVSTNTAYQQTLSDVGSQIENARNGVEGFGFGLDATTKFGRDNLDMLNDLASKSQDAAAAQLALDGNTEGYLATVTAGQQTIYDNAIALGATAEEAQALTDKIYAIPDSAEIAIIAETASATREIDRFIQSYTGRTIFFEAAVTGSPQAPIGIRANENGGLYNRGIKAFANGGMESGFYAGRKGGIHKFAEEALPWEAYISPKPGMEQQNIGIALESLARLGYNGYAGSSSTSMPSAAYSGPDMNDVIAAIRAIPPQELYLDSQRIAYGQIKYKESLS